MDFPLHASVFEDNDEHDDSHQQPRNPKLHLANKIVNKLKCFCHHHCPPESVDESICEVDGGGRCFAAVQEVYDPAAGSYEPEYSFGCFSSGDPSFLQCKGHLVNHEVPQSIVCCEGNFCNEKLRPEYKPTNVTNPLHPPSDYYLLQFLLATVLSLLVITFFIVLYVVCKYKAREKNARAKSLIPAGNKAFYYECNNGARDPYFNVENSSGSGSGMPLLVQSTVGQQIRLGARIGKGRYGDVFLGEWNGTPVAVKSFHSTEEHSWTRERQIYQLTLLKHPNILVALASDIRSRDGVTQMIIVTDYHVNGSLYDYLKCRTLTEAETMKLAISALSGLCHLHTEITGKPSKPGIAHRDLKSKNLLVKSNGEVCIADFGLAVCSVSDTKCVENVPNLKSGTKRYMAPEILDDSMKTQWFESYKQTDMYSFGLMLWEICIRTMINGDSYDCEPYSIPYQDETSADPSFEEMRVLIVEKMRRPEIPARWSKSKVLTGAAKLMQECWHRCPNVRLSALRVKKSLVELKHGLNQDTHTTFI